MTSFLLALVIAAPPRQGVEEKLPETAVFVHPLTSVVFSLLGEGLSVSAGAQFNAGARVSATFDVAVVTAPGTNRGGNDTFPATTSVSASAGPTFRLLGAGLRGVFLTPKLYVIGSSNSMLPGETSTSRTRWTTIELGAAVDLAAQWTVGPLFIGSVLGVGGGYALSPDAPSWASPVWQSTFGGALFGDMSVRSPGPVLALTLHLVRIGVAF